MRVGLWKSALKMERVDHAVARIVSAVLGEILPRPPVRLARIPLRRALRLQTNAPAVLDREKTQANGPMSIASAAPKGAYSTMLIHIHPPFLHLSHAVTQ